MKNNDDEKPSHMLIFIPEPYEPKTTRSSNNTQ